MRLGGPVFDRPEGPDAWCQAVRRLGYRAVFCPVPIGTDGETIHAYAETASLAGIRIIDPSRP